MWRGQDGGDNSFPVYNKEGEIMGAGSRRTSLSCFIILPCARSSHKPSFISNKLMPGAFSTSLSISHISEVTLSLCRVISPSSDGSVRGATRQGSEILCRRIRLQTPYLCVCHYLSCTQIQKMMNLQSRGIKEIMQMTLHDYM